MRKIVMMIVLALCLAPSLGFAAEGIYWTDDGYRLLVFSDRDESLLLGESRQEQDGLVQTVGVTFSIVPGQEDGDLKWSSFNEGNGTDKLEQAQPTADGWIAAGSSSSSNLENGWHEGYYDGKEPKTDGWVVRLDTEGEVLWTRCYGGTDWDYLSAICPAWDGGWILAGNTYSSDGDVGRWHDSGELFTQPDGWVVHIDEDGEILWEMALGGSGYDELMAVRQVPGGYMAVGMTDSADGDVEGQRGDRDGWVVLLDEEGNLTGQACYGGAGEDSFTAMSVGYDGEWLAAGASWSFDESPYHGWAVCLDERGGMLWEMRYGSETGIDHTERIARDKEGWTLAGRTQQMDREIEWMLGIDANGDAWAFLVQGEK